MRFRFLALLRSRWHWPLGGTRAEDLVQIYREAQQSDPTLAAARAELDRHAGARAAGALRVVAERQRGGERERERGAHHDVRR